MTTAYWWRGDDGHTQNFGDALTPILLQHFAGVEVDWASPEEADIVCCGSTLDVLPREGWAGVVAGAGQLHYETFTDLTSATVLGLRGEYTRLRTKHEASRIALGDPGLLVSELVTPEPHRYEIGVVPHLTDVQLFPRELHNARRYGYAEPILIDVTGDPLIVAQIIGSCRKIVASSLHGVITADAFGIPRRAERFPAMVTDAVHQGSTLKWNDHASALGQAAFQFGRLQLAPKVRVELLQQQLFEMFSTLKGILGVLSSSSPPPYLSTRPSWWSRTQ